MSEAKIWFRRVDINGNAVNLAGQSSSALVSERFVLMVWFGRDILIQDVADNEQPKTAKQHVDALNKLVDAAKKTNTNGIQVPFPPILPISLKSGGGGGS